MTGIARRDLLCGLAAWPAASWATSASAAPWPGGPARELAEGVWLLPGAMAAPSPANGGAVGNLVLLATPAGPVMLGTGGAHALARRALAFAHERLGRPVVLAVIPQPRPEFIMGTGACREAGVPVMATARAAELIAQRCHVCLENLRRDVGPPGSDGTELVLPDLTGTPEALAASPWWAATGLRPWFPAVGHTGADLVLTDPARGLALTGSLASRGRVPELDDPRGARPWRADLEALLARQELRQWVPGHGPAGEAALAAADTLAYLDALDRAVGAQLEQGAGLEETQRRVRLPAFRAWVGQGAVHARNVHKQYLAREADWLVAPR